MQKISRHDKQIFSTHNTVLCHDFAGPFNIGAVKSSVSISKLSLSVFTLHKGFSF